MKIEKKTTFSGVAAGGKVAKSPLVWTSLLLVLLLAIIFWRCFLPSYVLFSNDGPYGEISPEYIRMQTTIRGVWANLNWFGGEGLNPPPSVSSLMRLVTTPLFDAKFFCPISLLIVGIGACFCLRKFRLSPLACILGGLAATLNSDFFSTSCWGVTTQIIGFGFIFMAVGLIADTSIKRQWVRVILAGLAVGVGVMEAYDIGALFSLFVGAFVIYHSFFLSECSSSLAQKSGRGILKLACVAGFAVFIAGHSLLNLVGTQVQGIAGMDQDEQTKAARWAEATQWSLPKAETLQMVVPGFFGFRDSWYMYEYDEPKQDQYWGTIGSGGGLKSLIGTGFYQGIPVLVIGLWAVLQSFRRQGWFNIFQRRAVWFWLGTAVISLLLSYGKNAPFYRIFYGIPGASTIRNPDKFMHVASFALVILFAYGVHGLATGYLDNYVARVGGLFGQLKSWLSKATSFDRMWFFGSLIAIGLSIIGWLLYASLRTKMIAYVQTVGITADDAPGVVGFSIHAVGWFVLFLALTLGVLALIFSGQFSGSKSKWAGVLLFALVLFDLGRAGVPWIVYWDLDYKYAPDPIVQFLADKPYEHRVALLMVAPSQATDIETSQQFGLLVNAYNNDWKQHLFPYFNIQCAEVVQEPRMPVDKETYLSYFPPNNPVHFWQFSNSRYILGLTGFFKEKDPNQTMFRILKTFDMVPKRANPTTWAADWRTEIKPDGKLALVEFLGALPRAKLYSKWEIITDDKAVMQRIANPDPGVFDLYHDVVVSGKIPAPGDPNADPGAVVIDPNYKSKRIEMHADVKVPSVLLLSERYSPKWKVEVDGKPEELLKCDFIERGVYLTPGRHDIVMRFAPPITTLWISLAAIVLGLGLWGYLIFSPSVDEAPVVETPAETPKEKSAAKV